MMVLINANNQNNSLLNTKVGHHYWVLGGLYKDKWKMVEYFQQKTSIFSLRRKVWFDGPSLPEAILKAFFLYCVTSLNQTTAIFFGVGETMKGIILYDFDKDAWTEIGETPRDIYWCSCSSFQEKDYTQ